MIRKLVTGLHIPAEVLTGTSCLIIHAADKDAAGTGGAHEVCYREAVMEPKGGTPQAPPKRHKWKHRNTRIQEQVPQKKRIQTNVSSF